jgi:glyoxylate/succinic semialdehyde reductase
MADLLFSQCQELVALGATVGETPAAVVAKCRYTIAMLSDPSAALSVSARFVEPLWHC